MEHTFKADDITTQTKHFNNNPCSAVVMTGYLATDDVGDECYRLYRSLDFRQWISIGPETIMAQEPAQDEHKAGQSDVWLFSAQNVTMCEQVPLLSFAPQPRALNTLGDEDLFHEYPKK